MVPKSFGDGLAHVAFVQNTWDPAKWNDARIDGIPKKKNEIQQAAFTVICTFMELILLHHVFTE